jgi:hypothetical protein
MTFFMLKPDAATGVDGLMWPTREADLDRNRTPIAYCEAGRFALLHFPFELATVKAGENYTTSKIEMLYLKAFAPYDVALPLVYQSSFPFRLHSGRDGCDASMGSSRSPLATFLAWCWSGSHTQSRWGLPQRLAIALRLHGGVLRRTASNVAVPTLP